MVVQSTQTPKQYTPGNVAQASDAAVFERAGAGVYLTIEWIATYIQNAIGNGTAITFGTTAPANTAGELGDVFFNIGTGEVLLRGAAAWVVQANFALDSDVTTAITAAITAHTGAADPHPTYLTQAEATALYKPLATDDSAGGGLRLTLLTTTTGTPISGQIIANNATLGSITQLLISETDRNGAAIANLQDLLADTLRIQVQNEQSEDIYCYFRVNGAPIDSGTYRTVPVTFVSKPTAITTLTQLAGAGEVTVGLFGGAAVAASGVASGIRLIYNSSVTLELLSGEFGLNNAAINAATLLAISASEAQVSLVDITNTLSRLKVGAICRIAKDSTNYFEFTVASNFALEPIDQEDFRGNISSVKLVGSIANANVCFLNIISDAPGANGVTSGQAYVFETGTTTAAGQVRFAAGTLFLHESDRTAINLTTLWQNLTPGSIIQVIDETTPVNYANYTLGSWAGSPPKNVLVYELPATITGSNGTIADGVNVRVSFSIKGLQGIPGSGSTITVREIDGTPTGAYQILEFPNGMLTDQGSGVIRLNISGGGGLTYSTQSASGNIAEGQAFITSGATDLSFTAPVGTVAGQPLGVFRNSAALWSLLMPSGATIFGAGSDSSTSGIRSLSAGSKAYAIIKALAPNVWRIMDSSGIELIAPNPLSGLFLSWWPLNEASGTRNDIIGTNNLTPVNSPTSVAGLIGNAVAFSGDGGATSNQSSLTITSNATLQAGTGVSIFLTAAVRLTSIGTLNVIASKYSADLPGGPAEFVLSYFGATTQRFTFDCYDQTNNLTRTVTANNFGAASLNTWYIVMAWYDAAANTLNISVNNGTPNSIAGQSGFQIRATNAVFNIGSLYSNNQYGFNGQIDCAGFSKTIPSAAQRTAIYNGGAGIANPNA